MRTKILTLAITLCFSFFAWEGSAQNHSLISAGVSFGGAGWAGIPVQLRPSKNLAFEFGVYGRAEKTKVFDSSRWHFSPGVDAGFSVFLSHRDKPDKGRICSNGLYVRAGMSRAANRDVDILGLGWVREMRHPGKKSFLQIQVGPAATRWTETYLNTRYPPGQQEMTEGPIWSAMIHTRISWFFGLM